ncbi:purple acid phosphatase [Artemisia annua]|uniref:Purple acid phosphatase n=1 Tax=Artemisia annua TaxID=35608 RepID=A0A2U1L4C4_ARTAN|nr:purple acid phosphatase [Artemisia annua]
MTEGSFVLCVGENLKRSYVETYKPSNAEGGRRCFAKDFFSFILIEQVYRGMGQGLFFDNVLGLHMLLATQLQIHYEFHDNSRWDSWARYAECSTAYQHWIWIAGNHELDFEPSILEFDMFKSAYEHILVYSGCVESVYGDCKVICTLQPPQEYEEEADATT